MRVACLGECMVELADQADGKARLSFGGDTLNTAVYLARLGIDVSYITALGNDPFSLEMIAAWQIEGINTDLVIQVADRLPGLYAIRTDTEGERHFYYWRDQSPARELMQLAEFSAVAAAIPKFDYFYLSGITLSLYSESDLALLSGLLEQMKNNGGKLVFDSNHRASRWPDKQLASKAYDQVLQKSAIVLSTLEDEQAVYGDDSIEQCMQRLHNQGVGEILIKDGVNGCYLSTKPDKAPSHFPVKEIRRALDTTGAGDSFNAAYLASRIAGHSYCQSAERAQILSAEAVMHPGAIFPLQSMPDLKL